jgi:hypothetical protein
LEEYEGQINGDSECEAKFDSSDGGWSHNDDTALGEVVASETNIEGENECNEDYVEIEGQSCWTKRNIS